MNEQEDNTLQVKVDVHTTLATIGHLKNTDAQGFIRHLVEKFHEIYKKNPPVASFFETCLSWLDSETKPIVPKASKRDQKTALKILAAILNGIDMCAKEDKMKIFSELNTSVLHPKLKFLLEEVFPKNVSPDAAILQKQNIDDKEDHSIYGYRDAYTECEASFINGKPMDIFGCDYDVLIIATIQDCQLEGTPLAHAAMQFVDCRPEFKAAADGNVLRRILDEKIPAGEKAHKLLPLTRQSLAGFILQDAIQAVTGTTFPKARGTRSDKANELVEQRHAANPLKGPEKR